MVTSPALASLALFALQDATASKPSDSRDVTADFVVPEGLAVTLWAETPQLYNPTAMDVDARGRIWVTEAVNYRQWRGRNPGLHRPEGDRVLILEDTDGDGVCDSSKVFVQEKELVAPLGICVLGNKVIVSCSPDAIVYADEDGDDEPDERKVFLTGFGGHDHDHGLHSFVGGPDGRLYFNCGNAGPHIVKDKSGWSLRSGSLYRGGGENETDNAPRLLSDDQRVWTGGLVLRIEETGVKLTPLAHNFRNNYEVALDSFGNLFQADNDDDGNEGCRTLWCLEGGNHGYFSADGSRYWNDDRRPGQSTQAAHWHQDDPGVVPPGTINGAGGPTGVAVYEGELLAPRYLGMVLNCDAGRNVVYGHIPHAKGAGYELESTAFLSSERAGIDEKKQRWFRPSDVVTGTDGSVYVSDWWDPGVGGHAAGDGEAYGRILRIAPRGAKVQTPAYDVSTIDGAIAALCSPAVGVRWLGERALRGQGAAALPALEKLMAGKNSRLRARALWLIAKTGAAGAKAVQAALTDADPEIRITAFRALRQSSATWLRDASTLAADPSPAVRREVAITLRDVKPDARRDTWLQLAQQFDGKDRWYLEALGIGAEGMEETLIPVLAVRMGAKPAKWSETFAGIAWRLHPRFSILDFAARAASKDLLPAQRKQAVDSLAFIQDRAAAEAMVNLALAGPKDVQELATWWVQHRDTNDWSAYKLAGEIGPIGREGATMRWSSDILEKGSKDLDIDITGASTLWLVVTSGKRGNGCDWSDWIEPKLVGPKGEVKLTSLSWASAKSEWGTTNVDKNADGKPLAIDGKGPLAGIGTHAASEIVYRLPSDGFTRLKATAGIDDGGAKQAGGHPDVEFQVFADTIADRSKLVALQKMLLDAGAPASERARAIDGLCSDREGGLALIQLAKQGRLDPQSKSDVAQKIFKNPDLSVRALASETFTRPAADGASMPPVKELAALAGDARRGTKIFFGAASTCSTCHAFQGRGGDIGPDLTQIRAKYARPEVLDAILNPSAAIAFGYDAWLIETKDGELIPGFILSDGEKVVIKDTGGKRTAIAAADIASRTKQKISTMPDNVGLGLKPQDLADIASFLLADPGKPPELGEPISLFNGKDLSGWTFFLNDKNARMADVWSVADGVITCKGNPIGYIRTETDYESFQLELDWRFPPGGQPGNSGVLMRMTGDDKVWPKSIEAQLQHRNAGDIWNIDEFPMETDRSRTEGRHTEKALPCNEKPIGEWNHYKITLNGGDLTLEVNGEVQNRARWCDVVPGKLCLQSEGAPIQFRNIVLRPVR